MEYRYRMDTSFYPSFQGSFSYQPRAFVASSASPNSWSSTGSTPWHLDSAAIDHIATDVHNLDYYQPYLGHE